MIFFSPLLVLLNSGVCDAHFCGIDRLKPRPESIEHVLQPLDEALKRGLLELAAKQACAFVREVAGVVPKRLLGMMCRAKIREAGDIPAHQTRALAKIPKMIGLGPYRRGGQRNGLGLIEQGGQIEAKGSVFRSLAPEITLPIRAVTTRDQAGFNQPR